MFFGANKQGFPQIAPTCGITSFRYYAGPSDGPEGVPTSFPGGKTVPPPAGYSLIYSFKPTVDMVVTGQLDQPLKNFFKTVPAGTMMTAWHEGNLPAHAIPADSFLNMQQRCMDIATDVNPGISWGVIFGAGATAKHYVPGDMEWYGLDGYQRKTGETVEEVFDPNLNEIFGVRFKPAVAIIETNSFVEDHGLWFQSAFDYALDRDFIGFSVFYGSPEVPNTNGIFWADVDLPDLQDIARKCAIVS